MNALRLFILSVIQPIKRYSLPTFRMVDLLPSRKSFTDVPQSVFPGCL